MNIKVLTQERKFLLVSNLHLQKLTIRIKVNVRYNKNTFQ